MMTVTLTPELEEAVAEQARQRGATPEEVVMGTLREKFLPASQAAGGRDTLGDWERDMQAAAAQIADQFDGEQAGLHALQAAMEEGRG